MKFDDLCLLYEAKESLKKLPVDLLPVRRFIDHVKKISAEGTAPFRRDELEESSERMLSLLSSKVSKSELVTIDKYAKVLIDLACHGYGDSLFGIDAGDVGIGIRSATFFKKDRNGRTASDNMGFLAPSKNYELPVTIQPKMPVW